MNRSAQWGVWMLVVGALVLGAGVPQQAVRAQGQSGQVVWVDGADITTLDPAFVTDVVTNTFLDMIFQKVVRFKPDMTIEPELAESWSVAPDKLVWTFRLKSGFRFSNGNPVGAQAVKFTIERVLDPKTASPNRAVFAALDRVETPDDRTLRIVTKAPFPDLLQALADRAGAILDPSEVSKYADPREVGLRPVGSGPYMLAEWEPRVRLVFRKNPRYPTQRPFVDTIVYRPVPEDGTRMSMLKAGEADIVTRPVVEELPALRRDSRYKVASAPGYNLIMYELLTTRKPLDDVRVRWAINHAVDRKAIAEKLMNGLVTPRCSTVSPGVGTAYYFPQPCYDYDPERARSLLARAGHPGGIDLEIWSSNGRYLKDREMAEAVQAYLRAVGIRATVRYFEWATYRTKWTDPDRQMWVIGRSAGFTDFMFTRLFAKDQWDSGANNNTRFYDPRVEDLLVKARSTFDEKERAAQYRQIQEITWRFAPALYMHTQDIVAIHRANVTGFFTLPNEVVQLDRIQKR